MKSERKWQPIETAPTSGYFLVANDLGEVAHCEMQSQHKIVSGVWTWGKNATRWMPLPAPPKETA